MSRYLSYIIILTLSFAFVGCKQKSTKQSLIEDVEQFHIDTIEAKPVDTNNMTDAQRCRYRADEVLRKYPELYHATDKVQKLYDKWEERERIFIETVFVNKQKKVASVFQKNEKKLNARFDKKNFIFPLCAVLSDDTENTNLVSLPLQITDDEKTYTDVYREITFAIPDAIKSSDKSYSTDELRTAAEKARRAWLEYINAMPDFINELPEQCRDRMMTALLRIKTLQLIDLKNCYGNYWLSGKQGWLLPDDAPQDRVDNAEMLGLHMWGVNENEN